MLCSGRVCGEVAEMSGELKQGAGHACPHRQKARRDHVFVGLAQTRDKRFRDGVIIIAMVTQSKRRP